MSETRLLTDVDAIQSNQDQYKKELDRLTEDVLVILKQRYETGVSQAIIIHIAGRMIESAIPVLPEDVVEDYKYVANVCGYIAIGTFHNERQEGRI